MKNIIVSDWKIQNLAKKIDLYIKVFGEEPRNEWYKDWDWNLYPLSYGGNTQLMSLFYNKEALETQRSNRTQKNWYIECIVSVLEDDNLIGFTLWRSDTLSNLNNEKFVLSEKEYSLLLSNIEWILNDDSISKYFYAADLGVSIDYRWLWIASQLYDARYKKIVENGEKAIIVRTTKNRPVPYEWYKNKWFKEVFSYNDVQNRVIMILPLNSTI